MAASTACWVLEVIREITWDEQQYHCFSVAHACLLMLVLMLSWFWAWSLPVGLATTMVVKIWRGPPSMGQQGVFVCLSGSTTTLCSLEISDQS